MNEFLQINVLSVILAKKLYIGCRRVAAFLSCIGRILYILMTFIDIVAEE